MGFAHSAAHVRLVGTGAITQTEQADHLVENIAMRNLFVVAALLWSVATSFAADPVGTYSVEGNNPGGGSNYTGTVTIEQTGETYRVTWLVGGTRFVGTGIGDKNFIAVSYTSGSNTGLALYGADGGNWRGVWTYAGGRTVGTEIWKRQ
jgi:hypothetical protein